MRIDLLASLEAAIEQWQSDHHEQGNMPTDFYYPPNLHILMAKAAALVFDANAIGQQFAEEQEPK